VFDFILISYLLFTRAEGYITRKDELERGELHVPLTDQALDVTLSTSRAHLSARLQRSPACHNRTIRAKSGESLTWWSSAIFQHGESGFQSETQHGNAVMSMAMSASFGSRITTRYLQVSTDAQ
jgi:hypothetical protein